MYYCLVVNKHVKLQSSLLLEMNYFLIYFLHYLIFETCCNLRAELHIVKCGHPTGAELSTLLNNVICQ